MLAASLERLERELLADAVVLDVGGWWQPLARADWVVDVMPYETRAVNGLLGAGPERFSAATWVQRDICDREPWPFADDQFDFAVCAHTLEDVRDPVWACQELARVARAGYVEVPSRLEEQTYGFQGPWAGWGHHHWLVDLVDGGLEFVFKPHVLHNRPSDHFPPAFLAGLTDAERVLCLWWEGGFAARERLLMGPGELDAYLSSLVAARSPARTTWRERVLHRAGWELRRRGEALERRARPGSG